MFKNSVFQIFGNVISAAINLLIIIFTARFFGAQGRGEITYLLTCTGILQIFTAIIGNSVMIFMLSKYSKADILVISFLWTLFVAVLSIPVLLLFVHLSTQLIIYFYLIGVLQSFSVNLITFLSAELRYKEVLFLKVFQPIFLIALIAISYYSNHISIPIYWRLLIISFIPNLIFVTYITFKSFKTVQWKEIYPMIKQYLKVGGLNQTTYLMQFASYRFAVLIIAKTLGMKDVGIFGLWLSVTDAVWLIPMGLATVNMSYAAKENYQLKSIYKYILISGFISLMLIVVILIIPNNFYVLVLGKDFIQLKSLITFSSPIIVLFSINLIIAYYFSAKGLIKYNTLSSGFGCITILSVATFLTNKLGLTGAVLANCLSYTVTILITIILFMKHKKQLNYNSIPKN